MAFPNVSDIITTTLEARSGKIKDNVTKNNALLSKLSAKGRIKPLPGGRLIYEEISFAENGNGGWYSGYDTLPVAAQDVISAAEFNWKQYAVPVVISGLEMMQNSGKEQLINLIDARMDVAEGTMSNAIAQGIYSDGTGSGGKTITGLDAAVPTSPSSGTYGGISRTDYTFWRSVAYDPSVTSTATTIQANMNYVWSRLVRGSDCPDLIIGDANHWNLFATSLQTIQRITDPSSAALGFPVLKYMTADVVLDGGIGGYATTDTFYFLNTKYLYLRPHKERDMVPLSPEKRFAINQDASVSILGWMGNLTCSGAQFQGRLTT